MPTDHHRQAPSALVPLLEAERQIQFPNHTMPRTLEDKGQLEVAGPHVQAQGQAAGSPTVRL